MQGTGARGSGARGTSVAPREALVRFDSQEEGRYYTVIKVLRRIALRHSMK